MFHPNQPQLAFGLLLFSGSKGVGSVWGEGGGERQSRGMLKGHPCPIMFLLVWHCGEMTFGPCGPWVIYMHFFSSASIRAHMKMVEKCCLKSMVFVKLRIRLEKPHESTGHQLRDTGLLTPPLPSWLIKATRELQMRTTGF